MNENSGKCQKFKVQTHFPNITSNFSLFFPVFLRRRSALLKWLTPMFSYLIQHAAASWECNFQYFPCILNHLLNTLLFTHSFYPFLNVMSNMPKKKHFWIIHEIEEEKYARQCGWVNDRCKPHWLPMVFINPSQSIMSLTLISNRNFLIHVPES